MDTQKLRLEQIDNQIATFRELAGKQPPKGGWLKAIRQALGLTLRQQASLRGISFPVLYKAEQAEAEDRITLANLRRLAATLDCQLVYALVPNKPLVEVIDRRAETVARQQVLSTAHTMDLEDQRPIDSFIEKQIEIRKQALLTGKWSRLWR